MTKLITILGPTATGKTLFAARLAARIGGEIISADSRQVYRGMDIGTGKDLADYGSVPFHLIDICDAGEKYNVFRFQHDFLNAFNNIAQRGLQPILCGGSGLYLESVLRGYRMQDVPQNIELRQSLQNKSLHELTSILRTYKQLHNTTDVDTTNRAIRAIEIQEYYRSHPIDERQFPSIESTVIGIDVGRDVRRQRINERLRSRLEQGMVDEVRRLLEKLDPADLIYYGLEYKYLTLYVTGQMQYEEMVRQLEIAIHQFAKRQMTYFRGMERRGVKINWIDGSMPNDEKIDLICKIHAGE